MDQRTGALVSSGKALIIERIAERIASGYRKRATQEKGQGQVAHWLEINFLNFSLRNVNVSLYWSAPRRLSFVW